MNPKSGYFFLIFSSYLFITMSELISAQQISSKSTDWVIVSEEDSVKKALDTHFLPFDWLQKLPFRGAPQEYYGLFNGVIVQDFRGTDYVHVRGSRNDEIGYSFEGVDVRSWYTGLNMIRFIPEALGRVILHKSPGAPLGSAVVQFQHRLRRGSGPVHFTLRTESDRFTSSYKDRFDTYSYGYMNYLVIGQGGILKDRVGFFIAGESETFADHYRKYWEGFRIGKEDLPLIDDWTKKSLK